MTTRAWTWRHAVLESSLPATTRHVLLTLSCHVNDAGEPFEVPVRELCGDTGLSRKTLIKHLWAAEDDGWVKILEIGPDEFGPRRTQYTLTSLEGISA